VTFEPGSKMSVLGQSAFACSSIQSIRIPSSVQIVPKSCFKNCSALSNLTFEPGCRISGFGESAFAGCSSLRSICIPSSIETLSASCFRDCARLRNIVLEAGCRLTGQCVQDLRSKCDVTCFMLRSSLN
jgi:hypothetical protein